MPGSFTDYMDNKILDLLFGSKLWTPPTTLWFGLSLRKYSKDGQVSEPNPPNGYGRMGMTNTRLGWTSPDLVTRVNAFDIPFPAPTGVWGLITSCFIADSQYGGNILSWVDLTNPRNVIAPPAPIIKAGSLVISRATM